jgi:hypothetical protein
VAPLCTVRVSGVSEGQPEHVLSSDPDAWFETDESSDPMPWVQVVLPANVRVVRLTKYVSMYSSLLSFVCVGGTCWPVFAGACLPV